MTTPHPIASARTLAELADLINQSVDAMDADAQREALCAGKEHERIRDNFMFPLPLAGGICLALPEAEFLIINAHHIKDGPTPMQFMVARVGGQVFLHDRFVPQAEVARLAVKSYEEDLQIQRPFDTLPQLRVHTTVVPPDQVGGMTSGKWQQAIAAHLSARLEAHTQARVLENLAPPASTVSIKSRI